MRYALALGLVWLLELTPAFAQGDYADEATSAWFKSLTAPGSPAGGCCDQADCHRALSDFHDGQWWAKSNRIDKWVAIPNPKITTDETGHVRFSIFQDAVLCEGDPSATYDPMTAEVLEKDVPRVYCFAPPPLGF